jgi:photosystem II stability/assembly factor-like uncharacterized protein
VDRFSIQAAFVLLYFLANVSPIFSAEVGGSNANVPSDGTVLDIVSLSPDRWLACGQRGLLQLSENGGRTWEQVRLPRIVDGSINLFDCERITAKDVLVAGGTIQAYSLHSKGVLFRSRDAGKTWAAIPNHGLNRILGIHAFNSECWIVWGDFSTSLASSIAITYDAGRTKSRGFKSKRMGKRTMKQLSIPAL